MLFPNTSFSRIRSFFFASCLLTILLSTQACASNDWLDKSKMLLEVIDNQTNSDNFSLAALSLEDIASAFKEALHNSTEMVSKQLSIKDGFNGDPAIRIPLPDELKQVNKVLGKLGMSAQVDDFVVKLNRAAEAASLKAKALFWQAIKEMTFENVRQIYDGPDDAATEYFRKKMSSALRQELQVVIDESLSQVGAIRAYDRVMSKYQSLPFMPNVKADISTQVVDKTMAGIFYYIAKEEAAIRHEPSKRTSELLRKVFGAK